LPQAWCGSRSGWGRDDERAPDREARFQIGSAGEEGRVCSRPGLPGWRAAHQPPGAKLPVLRTWDVSLIRKRRESLGCIKAPDQQSAEAGAVEQFNLNPEQRKRLIVIERG
jgi:hypothetical protein